MSTLAANLVILRAYLASAKSHDSPNGRQIIKRAIRETAARIISGAY